MEKRMIVYKNDKPVLKFYVKSEHTPADIQSYFNQKYPNYRITFFSDDKLLSPYNFEKLNNGKIFLTKMGKIRIGQQRRAKSYPTSPAFTTIPAWSRGAGEWKQLSPFYIKFPDGVIFENFWQSFKVWRKVDAQKGVWSHPSETHVDSNDNPNAQWEKWHEKLMKYSEPIRRPNGRAIPLYAYFNGEKLSVEEARRKIYIPYLQELYRDHPVYQKLRDKVKSGENIMLIEPDGPLLEAYPNGLEVNLKKLQDLIGVTNYSEEGYPEKYRPYGHGYVIALTILEDLSLQ